MDYYHVNAAQNSSKYCIPLYTRMNKEPLSLREAADMAAAFIRGGVFNVVLLEPTQDRPVQQ